MVLALLAASSPLAAFSQTSPPPVAEVWHPLIYFETGSAEISERGQAHLRRIVDYAVDNPMQELVIRAHADSAGSASDNLKLSTRRAQAVVDQLRSMGLSPKRITVQALGETAPPVVTADGVSEPLNRLVSIDWR
jgi:outer membrane protein OmpA-like peptidoglycan-associated protein